MEQLKNKGGAQSGASSLLNVAGLVGDSIVDGPGLRFSIFTQGCPHACPGCHNPATHPFTGGTEYTVEELYEKIHEWPLCRAVTYSGGDPFCQPGPLLALSRLLKPEGYELAAYTGFTFEQLLAGTQAQQQLLAQLDTLVDGPFIEAERDLTLRFRGSANQRIIRVPESLSSGSVVLETNPRWVGGSS